MGKIMDRDWVKFAVSWAHVKDQVQMRDLFFAIRVWLW